MLSNTKCGLFLSCLQFAMQLNSLYSEFVLKPKQVICLENVFLNLDVLAILPTGYGKSLIFCLIPAPLFAKKNGSKCRLLKVYHQSWSLFHRNALIENQILQLGNSGTRATALDVKRSRKDDNEDSEA